MSKFWFSAQQVLCACSRLLCSGIEWALPWRSVVAVLVLAVGGLPCLTASAQTAGPVGTKFSVASGWAGISSASDGNNFLVALGSDPTVARVAAQLVSHDGTRIGSPIALGTNGQSCCAAGVAFDGTNYLVVWEDDQGIKNSSSPFAVHGRFISTAGVPVGSDLTLTTPGIYFDGVSMLAYAGGKYLLTYTRLINPQLGEDSTNRYIAGRLIAPDGTLGAEFRISGGFGARSGVTTNGENFFVVWGEDSKDYEVRGRFVTPGGVLLNEISINASTAPSDNPVAVSFDGTNYMVVWNDMSPRDVNGYSATGHAFAQRISVADGSLVGAVIEVSTDPGKQVPMSIAFNGNNYVVTWADMTNNSNWDMYGQFVGRDGVLVGNKFAINTDAGNQMGGVGCFSGQCLALISSGIVMGRGGPSQVGEVYGAFLTPTFTATYLDPGYTATSFTTLPFDTRAIAFDQSLNLYTASAANDNSGHVSIVAFSAASGYVSASTVYSYVSSASSVTGLDFYGSQLLVSESYASGNSGKISDAKTGVAIKDLASFRPSGFDARDSTLLTTRLVSDLDFGNVYRLNSDGTLTTLIANIPLRGIATDAAGNIFVSTRNSDFGSFLANSIYKFSAADNFLPATATRIVTLGGGGSTELSFDNLGNLYTLYTADPLAPTSTEIIRISPIGSNASTSVNLVPGWNLLGNSVNAPLTVATTFGDAAKVSTVWKWVASGTTPTVTYPNWAFYSPAQSDGGQAYAASKGLDFLTTINAGDGFWVNAATAFTVQLPAGTALTSASFQGMASGWHLIATGDAQTPNAFNTALSLTPPGPGSVAQNVTSLWAWDNTASKWYFYAPSLQAQSANALTDYISANGYLDFTQASKTLGPGVGFWVNKP